MVTTTPARRTTGPEGRPAASRMLVALTAIIALVAVGLMSLFATPASASTLTRPQNAVGVIAHQAGQRVGAHEDIPAGQGRARAPNYDQTVVGSGVGAEAEAADLSLQAAHASEEAASSAETEGVADAAGGGSGGPSFITNSNGETIPVPEGASGLTPVDSGKGFQFSGGSGGNGLDSRVTGVRVMDPVTGGKYPYPNGYISYMNAEGQTVNPWTGQTVSNADPWAHWPWNP